MTTNFDEAEKRLLKQVIEDLIIVYDLKGKNLLLLLKEGNTDRYHFFSNEFKGKIEFTKNRLKHELKPMMDIVITNEGKSEADGRYYVDIPEDFDVVKEEFGTFDAIFILNLERHLNQNEIVNASLLLKEEGVLFHVETIKLSPNIYKQYLFTRLDEYLSSEGRYFSVVTAFRTWKTFTKHHEFFEDQNWFKKVNMTVLFEIDENTLK